MSFQKLMNIFSWEFDPGSGRTLAACLIHASRTRATGACTGQSSGERVSNTWVTCPSEGDNIRKRMLKPHRFYSRMTEEGKEASASADGWTRGALASWWGNGSPRPWCIADLEGDRPHWDWDTPKLLREAAVGNLPQWTQVLSGATPAWVKKVFGS